MFLNKKNNKKLLIMLSIITVIVLAFVGYRMLLKEKSTIETDSRDIVEENPKAEEGKETPPSVTKDSPKENESSTQPFVKISNSIQISSPVAGTRITEGTELSGTVGNETGILGYRIKSIQSGVIIDYLTNIEISKAGQSFNFSVDFEKEPVVGDVGNLEVYIIKNNQKIDSVSFEVKF